MSISQNITELKNLIHTYEHQYARQANSVALLAVSKQQSIAKIQEAIDAGLTAFGENYLQEALEKIEHFRDQALEWHFIGPIQSNKTKKIAENFAWVQSVSNLKIAKRLHEQRPAELPPLNICIQINISHETSKSGIALAELLDFAAECKKLSRLSLRGLMTIPAPQKNFEEQRKEFHKLAEAAQMLRSHGFMIETLSMGMSDDLEAAIAEGATLVRIGTKIFGKRL